MVEVGQCFQIRRGVQIRVVAIETTMFGAKRARIENLTGKRIGALRWEFAEYLVQTATPIPDPDMPSQEAQT